MKVAPGVTTITKTEGAYYALRLAIESGELAPGTRLRTIALQERLRMSPTPIREALRLLQADGLVEHRPYHGMVVTERAPETIAEIYRVRILLEAVATQWAADRATGAELREIRRLHEQLVKAVSKSPGRSEVAALNAAWHSAVYAACGSAYLQEFIERLWTAIGKALWVSSHATRAVSEHGAITEALERRDAALAGELMRSHIENGAMMYDERVRQILSKPTGGAPAELAS